MKPKTNEKKTSKVTKDPVTSLRRLVPELRDRYGVTEIGVFGSYVRGTPHSRSDLDVLVSFAPGRTPGLLRFISLEDEISETVGVKVDLVLKSALRPFVAERILAEVVIL